MLFRDFKCPTCGNNTLSVDCEATLDSYIENEFKGDSLLIFSDMSPPVRPGYIIYTCTSKDCNTKVKYTEKEILQQLLDDWAEIAWTMLRYQANHAHQFEEYRTRYLYEDKLGKFIKNDGKYISTEEVFKDFFNFIKDEKKKRS